MWPWGDYSNAFTSLWVGEGITKVSISTFSECNALQTVFFADSVAEIADSAFDGCAALSEVHLPRGLTTIADHAFSCCPSLQKIEIPDGVTVIEFAAFSDCASLMDIRLPDGLKKIGGCAFSNTALEAIAIPDGVEYIGDSAFGGSPCRGIRLPSALKALEWGLFEGCKNLEWVEIPDDVVEIKRYAFRDCVQMTALSLSSSVTYIDEEALTGSGITTIYAPKDSYAWHWALTHGLAVYSEAPAGCKLQDLAISADYVVQNTPQDITFTVRFTGTSVGSGIQLFDSGNAVLGLMHDDGKNGDKKAGDGVYTLMIADYTPAASGNLEFHAAVGGVVSNTAVLMSFLDITEENDDIVETQLESLESAIKQAESAYADADGYVSGSDVSKVITALEPLLKRLVDVGVVLKYVTESDSAYIKLSTGIAMIYKPPIRDMLAGSSPTSREILDIVTDSDMDANYSRMKSFADGYFEEGLERSGVSITINPLRLSFTREDESIQAFDENKIIWWLGHGTKWSGMSALGTNSKTWGLDGVNKLLWTALRNEEWVVAGEFDLFFTYKYIQNHCPRMDGAVILLASCDIGSDARFAKALVDKGAKAVLTFSDWTYAEYAIFLTQNMLMHMSLINPSTHNHYTLWEAQVQAMSRFGQNDEEYGRAKGYTKSPMPSYPEITGDRDVRLAEAANLVFEVKNILGMIENARVTLEGQGIKKSIVTKTPDAEGLPFHISELDALKVSGGLTAKQEQQYYREYTNHIVVPEAKYGKYKLTVSADGYKTVEKTINVTNGSVQTIVMGAQVTGVVKAKKTLSPLNGTTVQLMLGDKKIAETTSDGNGQFSFEGLPYGQYTLRFTKPTYQTTDFTFAVNDQSATIVLLEDILLDLDAVKGRVVDIKTGKPIARAGISLRCNSSTRVESTVADDQGAFYKELATTSPMMWTAVISAPGYGDETREFSPYGRLSDLGTIQMTPEKGAKVAGTVKAKRTESAISGVTVELYSGGKKTAETTTDRNGAFTLENLPKGSYELKFKRAYYQDEAYSFSISDPAVDVTLPQAILMSHDAVTGKVADAVTGKAIQSASIVLDNGGATVSTDARGIFYADVESTASQKWTATISATGYGSETREFYPFGKVCDLGTIQLLPDANQHDDSPVWDGTIASAYDGGSGTQSDPYRIANGSQLALLAQEVNAGNAHSGDYFILTRDIYLNDVSNRIDNYFFKSFDLIDMAIWTSEMKVNAWTPIGHRGTTWGSADNLKPFSGHFDGRGCTVYAPVTGRDTWEYVGGGLFGYVNGGTIQNLTVADTSVGGNQAVGGVVGFLANGTLSNCVHNGGVNADEYAGGLVGYATQSAMVTSCKHTGKNGAIYGKYSGGVVGTLYNSSRVVGCSNDGYAMIGLPCGGVVGFAVDSFITGNSFTGLLVVNDSSSSLYGLSVGTIVGQMTGTTTSGNSSSAKVYSIDGTSYSNIPLIGLYWNGSQYVAGK